MFAEISADTLGHDRVLGLPTDAVLINAGQSVVYMISAEGRAHQVEVETGIYNPDYTEITGGVRAGQAVIVAGNTLVSEGVKVKTAADQSAPREEAANE
jgi:hypothetical protein